IELLDDGTGGMVDRAGAAVTGASIVYATGVVTIPATYMVPGAELTYADYSGSLPSRLVALDSGRFAVQLKQFRKVMSVGPVTVLTGFINGSPISATYKADDAVDVLVHEEHPIGSLEL